MALKSYIAAPGAYVQIPGSRHDAPAKQLSESVPFTVDETSDKGRRLAKRARRGEVIEVPNPSTSEPVTNEGKGGDARKGSK